MDQTRPPVREARAPDQTHPPAGRPDDSMRTAAPGASGFEGQAQIEHLLMEGEVRMTVADYANAVKVYEKLVKTAPRVAAFHLRLAVAMACYPRTSKLAEREFYEAARLEPENAEIHYQWGLYYKVMKIKSRAVAEMRTAVRLSPKHKAARAELESSPKDSLPSLKKLFRSRPPTIALGSKPCSRSYPAGLPRAHHGRTANSYRNATVTNTSASCASWGARCLAVRHSQAAASSTGSSRSRTPKAPSGPSWPCHGVRGESPKTPPNSR